MTSQPTRSRWERFRAFVLTGHDDPLPARVQGAIRRQEDRAERMIGWAQLAVVMIFGSLYFASPSTSIPDAPFEPVPYILALYLGLTVIRIIWSYVTRLPAWSLAISSIYDIGLLMTLIWLFHIQYQQPPSFYLKAPTLLYVFIFIALRALRFDARFVLWTGLVAAFGWGFMIVYVVTVDPANSMITHDYIAYM
ncbi:MAG: adenylate/guanylate cyclase domain-containing protein, partial [Pseudomonadota bacterium]